MLTNGKKPIYDINHLTLICGLISPSSVLLCSKVLMFDYLIKKFDVIYKLLIYNVLNILFEVQKIVF